MAKQNLRNIVTGFTDKTDWEALLRDVETTSASAPDLADTLRNYCNDVIALEASIRQLRQEIEQLCPEILTSQHTNPELGVPQLHEQYLTTHLLSAHLTARQQIEHQLSHTLGVLQRHLQATAQVEEKTAQETRLTQEIDTLAMQIEAEQSAKRAAKRGQKSHHAKAIKELKQQKTKLQNQLTTSRESRVRIQPEQEHELAGQLQHGIHNARMAFEDLLQDALTPEAVQRLHEQAITAPAIELVVEKKPPKGRKKKRTKRSRRSQQPAETQTVDESTEEEKRQTTDQTSVIDPLGSNIIMAGVGIDTSETTMTEAEFADFYRQNVLPSTQALRRAFQRCPLFEETLKRYINHEMQTQMRLGDIHLRNAEKLGMDSATIAVCNEHLSQLQKSSQAVPRSLMPAFTERIKNEIGLQFNKHQVQDIAHTIQPFLTISGSHRDQLQLFVQALINHGLRKSDAGMDYRHTLGSGEQGQQIGQSPSLSYITNNMRTLQRLYSETPPLSRHSLLIRFCLQLNLDAVSFDSDLCLEQCTDQVAYGLSPFGRAKKPWNIHRGILEAMQHETIEPQTRFYPVSEHQLKHHKQNLDALVEGAKTIIALARETHPLDRAELATRFDEAVQAKAGKK